MGRPRKRADADADSDSSADSIVSRTKRSNGSASKDVKVRFDGPEDKTNARRPRPAKGGNMQYSTSESEPESDSPDSTLTGRSSKTAPRQTGRSIARRELGKHEGRRPRRQASSGNDIADHLAEAPSWIFRYICGVFAGFLHLISPLLSVLLLVGAIYLGLCYILQPWLLKGPIYSVFSTVASVSRSVCSVPGASFIPLCHGIKRGATNDSGQDDNPINFEDIVEAQSALQVVVFDNQGFTAVRHQLPDTSRALKELSVAIKYTDLPAANILHSELQKLSTRADLAFETLLYLAAHIDRAVDGIALHNVFTLERMQTTWTNENERSYACRTLARCLPRGILYPLGIEPPASVLIRDIFLQHTNHVISNIEQAVAHAQQVQTHLNDMSNQFDVVSDTAAAAGYAVNLERDRRLSGIWDKVVAKIPGTNSWDNRKEFERKLNHLVDVQRIEKAAITHVDRVIARLREIRASLSSLGDRAQDARWEAKMRERVDDVPFGVHMKSMELGVEALRELTETRRKKKDDEQKRYRAGWDPADEYADPMAGKEYMIDAPGSAAKGKAGDAQLGQDNNREKLRQQGSKVNYDTLHA